MAASLIQFDKLIAEIEELTQQIGLVKCNLDRIMAASPRQHVQPFKSRMDMFLKQGSLVIQSDWG